MQYKQVSWVEVSTWDPVQYCTTCLGAFFLNNLSFCIVYEKIYCIHISVLESNFIPTAERIQSVADFFIH